MHLWTSMLCTDGAALCTDGWFEMGLVVETAIKPRGIGPNVCAAALP